MLSLAALGLIALGARLGAISLCPSCYPSWAPRRLCSHLCSHLSCPRLGSSRGRPVRLTSELPDDEGMEQHLGMDKGAGVGEPEGVGTDAAQTATGGGHTPFEIKMEVE